jgi:hypothetical protein
VNWVFCGNFNPDDVYGFATIANCSVFMMQFSKKKFTFEQKQNLK